MPGKEILIKSYLSTKLRIIINVIKPTSPLEPNASTRSVIFPNTLPTNYRLAGPTKSDAIIPNVSKAIPRSVIAPIVFFILSIVFTFLYLCLCADIITLHKG